MGGSKPTNDEANANLLDTCIVRETFCHIKELDSK